MIAQFIAWWERELVVGNTIGDVLMFAVTLFCGMVMAKLISLAFHGRLKDWANRSKTRFDDQLLLALERPLNLFLLGLTGRMSMEFLKLPEGLGVFTENVLTVMITVFIAWGLTRVLDAIRIVFIDPRVEASETKLDDQLLPIFDRTLKAVVWCLAIMIAFSNLGFDILGLLTGLGIGGLAVAMAAQATLSNLLGSVTIFADQPFQVGDLITVREHTGVVSSVGLRASRIRTVEGFTVTVPNSTVVEDAVINHTIDGQWRHDLHLGLTYATSADDVEKAMRVLTEILEEHPRVETGFAVRFLNFGDSALELGVAYFVRDDTVGRFLDTQSEVNLAIKRRFDAEGLDMAFPTMSVYLERG